MRGEPGGHVLAPVEPHEIVRHVRPEACLQGLATQPDGVGFLVLRGAAVGLAAVLGLHAPPGGAEDAVDHLVIQEVERREVGPALALRPVGLHPRVLGIGGRAAVVELLEGRVHGLGRREHLAGRLAVLVELLEGSLLGLRGHESDPGRGAELDEVLVVFRQQQLFLVPGAVGLAVERGATRIVVARQPGHDVELAARNDHEPAFGRVEGEDAQRGQEHIRDEQPAPPRLDLQVLQDDAAVVVAGARLVQLLRHLVALAGAVEHLPEHALDRRLAAIDAPLEGVGDLLRQHLIGSPAGPLRIGPELLAGPHGGDDLDLVGQDLGLPQPERRPDERVRVHRVVHRRPVVARQVVDHPRQDLRHPARQEPVAAGHVFLGRVGADRLRAGGGNPVAHADIGRRKSERTDGNGRIHGQLGGRSGVRRIHRRGRGDRRD